METGITTPSPIGTGEGDVLPILSPDSHSQSQGMMGY